jgi:hypothetical protein
MSLILSHPQWEALHDASALILRDDGTWLHTPLRHRRYRAPVRTALLRLELITIKGKRVRLTDAGRIALNSPTRDRARHHAPHMELTDGAHSHRSCRVSRQEAGSAPVQAVANPDQAWF